MKIIKSMCDTRGGHDGYLAYIGEYGDTKKQAEAKLLARIEQFRQEGAKVEREKIAEILSIKFCGNLFEYSTWLDILEEQE